MFVSRYPHQYFDSVGSCSDSDGALHLEAQPTNFAPILWIGLGIIGGLWLLGEAINPTPSPRWRKIAPRDTYRYQLICVRRMVYEGISNDPERRFWEHRRKGKRFTTLRVLGVARSRSSALRLEREALNSHLDLNGRLPKYNKV